MSEWGFVVLLLLAFANLILWSLRKLVQTHNRVLLEDYADCLRNYKASEPLKKVEPDLPILASLVDDDVAESLISAEQFMRDITSRIKDLDSRELAQELDDAEVRFWFSEHIRTTGRYRGGDLGNEVVFVRTDANPRRKPPDTVFSIFPFLPLAQYLVWFLNLALLFVLLGQYGKYRSSKRFNRWLLGKNVYYHTIARIANYRFKSAGCDRTELLRLLPGTCEFARLIQASYRKEEKLDKEAEAIRLDSFREKQMFRSRFRDWLDGEHIARRMTLKSAGGVLASQTGEYQTSAEVVMRTDHPKSPDDRFRELFGFYPTFPSKKSQKRD